MAAVLRTYAAERLARSAGKLKRMIIVHEIACATTRVVIVSEQISNFALAT